MQVPSKPIHADAIGTDRAYALRPCPACGTTIFGMPGGRDAHCPTCGYKDPCCSD
jgi:predicted RNA-binding Zn-ribbon protein involved in translation (DUF1610 family)